MNTTSGLGGTLGAIGRMGVTETLLFSSFVATLISLFTQIRTLIATILWFPFRAVFKKHTILSGTLPGNCWERFCGTPHPHIYLSEPTIYVSARVSMSGGTAIHYYKGKLIISSSDAKRQAWGSEGNISESMTCIDLWVPFWQSDFSWLLRIENPEARAFVSRPRIRVTCNNSWIDKAFVDNFPLEGTFLEAGTKDTLLSMLDHYLSKRNRNIKDKFGQPDKLVILLHGAPGTGKSRLVSVLANHYKRDLYIRDLLDTYCPTVPTGSFVLFDEFEKTLRESAMELSRNGLGGVDSPDLDPKVKAKLEQEGLLRWMRKGDLAYSKMLSLLDGVASLRGCVIFLVVNDIEQLPHTLTRSRRVDLKIDLGKFSSECLLSAMRYWSEGKADVSLSELSPFDKKFVGAEAIDIIESLYTKDRLVKDDILSAFRKRLANSSSSSSN
jgi:hypothetical protein